MTISRSPSLSLRIASLFCFAGLALGCGGESGVGAARQAWVTTENTCGTYHYAISTSSFRGTGTTTTIEITAGVATTRKYEGFHTDIPVGGSVGTKVVDEQWTETGAEVGTHQAGQPAKTMEALYDDCARDVAPQDPAKNDITIEWDARGVLQECWYVPLQCLDDCRFGVVVDDFACGALDP